MKNKEEIIREAARCHKAAEEAKEKGYYMSWQQLCTREKALLWCIEDDLKEVEND